MHFARLFPCFTLGVLSASSEMWFEVRSFMSAPRKMEDEKRMSKLVEMLVVTIAAMILLFAMAETVGGYVKMGHVSFEVHQFHKAFVAAYKWTYDFDVSDYADHLHVVGYGFYEIPNGDNSYSNSLGLGWFKNEFVLRPIRGVNKQV